MSGCPGVRDGLNFASARAIVMTVLLRRVAAAALFAGLLTLQLGLVGTGAACTMEDSETRGHSHADATASGTDSERATGDEPCEHPVSHNECRAMAPCGAAFDVGAPAAEPQPAPLGETIVAAVNAMPPSVSFPPERRPPRA